MPLPDSSLGLVIRTNHVDQATWETVVRQINEGIEQLFELYPGQEPYPLLTFVDDPELYELTPDGARDLIDEDEDWEQHGTLFLTDAETMTTPYRTLIAVTGRFGDDDEESRWQFRLRPESVGKVHLALSTKMSFTEFVEDVDEGGFYTH